MIPNNYSRITDSDGRLFEAMSNDRRVRHAAIDWERKQKNSLIKGLFIFVLTEAAAMFLILRIMGVL